MEAADLPQARYRLVAIGPSPTFSKAEAVPLWLARRELLPVIEQAKSPTVPKGLWEIELDS